MLEPLYLREDPQHQQRDLISRALHVRAATIDEKARSVEVVMSTEGQVSVFDWMRGEIIDEVLRADGGEFPAQLPFLENHFRWSLDSVLGSVRNIRREGETWVGRAFFAEGDQLAERAWNKVKQGHLTDVSVGYRTIEFEDIPPNTTRTVAGKTYTAGARTLRVSKRWQGKELSLVPIGADRGAKVREDAGASGKEFSMNPQLRKYLESLGLRADASEAVAQAYLDALGGDLRKRADAIAANKMTLEQALAEGQRSDAGNRTTPPANPEGQRSATVASGTATIAAVAEPLRIADQSAVRVEAAQAERQRISQIQELAGRDIPNDLVQRAINENMSPDAASALFLRHFRSQGTAPVAAGGITPGSAPAGIVRDHERNMSAGLVAMALLIRNDASDQQLQRVAPRLGVNDRWENIAERSRHFSDMSMLDICRLAIRMDGKQEPWGRQETIRAAVSGGSLTSIFTTSVQAQLVIGYDEETDTTVGWIEEVEVPNFKTNDEIDVLANARLEKHARGGKAKSATMEDTNESWKIARYTKDFAIDEMDIIDDNLGALMQAPMKMGKAARKLRPDLVYSLLLRNPTMGTDGKAVFHADHGNLASGAGSALAKAALQARITAMAKHRLGSGKNVQPLNIRPAFLIVPPELQFTAAELVTSATIHKSTGENSTVEFGRNVIADLNLEVRSDSRISDTGVLDPTTDTVRTGTTTNWFLASRPGRTLKVGYLRGSGRVPMVRSYTLDKGQWGIGWDVKHDIGAVVVDYRGLDKSAGA